MPQPTSDEGNGRLNISHLARSEAEDDFAADVRGGLTSDPKRLPPKYFYDQLGSQLFEAICLLPEYYLTRAENEIFERRASEIVRAASRGEPLTLLEMGSGSATKTRRIISALLERQNELLYVPVDISPAALEQSARVLLQAYPQLRVSAYASDYDTAIPRLRDNLSEGGRALVLFLGSNIGNFDREGAHRFLRNLRGVMRAGDALLLGADLKKDASVLEAAYDDSLGVTAAFNLNLLARINRELRADFDLRRFRHVAHYNEAQGRVEMHIESEREQRVKIRELKLTVGFRAGERMHTENSHKYDLEELTRLASETGYTRDRTWLDDEQRFSSNLFIAVEGESERGRG